MQRKEEMIVSVALKYGLEPGDYSIVSGNESRLAQFIAQKQIDASILRSITYENLKNM